MMKGKGGGVVTPQLDDATYQEIVFDEASTWWAPKVLPDSEYLEVKPQEKLGETSDEKLQEPKEASNSPRSPKEKHP